MGGVHGLSEPERHARRAGDAAHDGTGTANVAGPRLEVVEAHGKLIAGDRSHDGATTSGGG